MKFRPFFFGDEPSRNAMFGCLVNVSVVAAAVVKLLAVLWGGCAPSCGPQYTEKTIMFLSTLPTKVGYRNSVSARNSSAYLQGLQTSSSH